MKGNYTFLSQMIQKVGGGGGGGGDERLLILFI